MNHLPTAVLDAPIPHQPTVKRLADSNGPDFFPTPAWATHALIAHENFQGSIWEPACGDGAMSEVLKLTGKHVISSDLYDRGYGTPGFDFLKGQCSPPAANVVTNPPFRLAEEFVRQALKTISRTGKAAFLLRLAFLEGAGRAKGLFKEHPVSRIWVFSERITFYPPDTPVAGGGTMAYAWFVWDRTHTGPPEIHWLQPGYRKQYLEWQPGRPEPIPDESAYRQARLEYLRQELRAERISWGELAELQGLAAYIEPGDVELLEPAGVPEYPEEPCDA